MTEEKTLFDKRVIPQGTVSWILEGKEYIELEDVKASIKNAEKKLKGELDYTWIAGEINYQECLIIEKKIKEKIEQVFKEEFGELRE